MGYSFTHGATKKDIVGDLIVPAGGYKCLDHKVVGNILWAVYGGPRGRFIGCSILKHDRGYGWGSKNMTESEGPYYYTCPLKFLDMVPEPVRKPYNELAGDSRNHSDFNWRQRVRDYHKRKESLKKIKDGSQILFAVPIGMTNGRSVAEFKVSVNGKKKRFLNDGIAYRLSRDLLDNYDFKVIP